MNRLRPSQLLLSAAVLALYAPALLAVGDPGFRGPWLAESIGPFPLSVWLIGGLMTLLVCLAWFFADTVFEQQDGQDRSDRP